MFKLKQLLEARSKSLEKLGNENALDVLAEFPIESIKLLFRKLKQVGLEVNKNNIEKIIDRLRRSVTDSLGPHNPMFSTNIFEIEFDLAKNKEPVEIEFQVKKNKLYWGFMAGPVRVGTTETKPIKLTNISLNTVFDNIIEELAEAKKLGKRYGRNREEYEKGREFSKKLHKEEPKIFNKLKRIAEKYHFKIDGSYSNEDRYYLTLHFTNYLIKPFQQTRSMLLILSELEDFQKKIRYRYQVEEAKKFLKLLDTRLVANNYFIIRMGIMGNDDGFFIDIESGNSKDYSKKSLIPLKEMHDKRLKNFMEKFNKFKIEPDEELSRSDAYHIVIEKIFEKKEN